MALPPARVERVAVTDEVDLHVLRWDGWDGVPFVLVHGLASNARLWDGVAGELASAGHPVLAYDQRGHGRSTKPDDGYDMTTVTDDLRVVVEKSGFEEPVLVGQSWGGNVVMEFAARFPGVAGAVAGVDGGAIELSRDFPEWERCAEQLRPPLLVGTPRRDMETMLRASHPDWSEAALAGVLASFEIREDGTVAPWLTIDRHLLVLRGLWEHRPSERFAHIDDPTLLIVAASEHPAAIELLPRAIRDRANVEVVPMAGDHDLHAQRPVEVAALLRTLAR